LGRTATTYLSYKKGKPKNFPPNTSFYFGKAFEVPRNFSRKVSCVKVWGGQPQHSIHVKNAEKSAFLFFHYMLELRSKPCFKVLLKKRLKNPQNFPSEYTTSFD